MDEKTTESSVSSEEITLSSDNKDDSAGNGEPGPEEQLPVETENVQPLEPTEETNALDASQASTDTNDDIVEGNLNSGDGSSTEIAVSEANTELLSSVPDEFSTNIDNLEETSTNELVKESIKDDVEPPEPMEVEQVEQKTEQVHQEDPNSAVYQLEEELKRLHGGDTSEETKTETFMTDLSVTAILEDKEDITLEKEISESNSSKNNLLSMRKMEEEKPIMKDSDLEEMLSADVVIKDPVLIKEAQENLRTTDILVCGKCHEVYHFVEEFKNHKSQNCTAKSTIIPICEGESKPQVWGFTLWKTTQNRSLKPGEPVPTSWKTYQRWCKLAPIDKNAWISAGQTLQFCHKISTGKISEVKVKPQNSMDNDSEAKDGFAKDLESNKENSNLDNSKTAKNLPKPIKTDPVITPVAKTTEANINKAVRTPNKNSEKSEFAVERIVAKRFNAKKKCWEYQIKWEHFSSDQNTWEPLLNLTHCKQMVDAFEEQLRKLKADKAKQVGIVAKNRKISSNLSSSSIDSTSGRPQRSSKQKALNQVKAWCGNISDDDSGGGTKRKLEDDDSDDSFEKKMKTEDFSDDSDFDLNTVINTSPKVPPLRKLSQKPTQQGIQILKNGVDKAAGPLPHNILIPDANGVVRINQKQLPSLSTGVYIMSKTAGIIKLDSATSKVATSGGQTIVKVAPKIGQTQIKIVKKDGSTTTTTKQVPSISATSTPVVTKVYKPIITKVKKPMETQKKIEIKTPEPTRKPPEIIRKITPAEIKKHLETQKSSLQSKILKVKEDPRKTLTSMMDMSAPEDDSDDGLEELPFPEDINVPEPESPPGDFILDPITGKIAGVEYPEKTEPEHESEVEPTEEAKSDTSLDNIVKLAAADITEDDLKNDDMDVDTMASHQEEEDEDLIHISEKKNIIRNEHLSSGVPVPKTIVRMPVGANNRPQIRQQQRPQSSILNKVLTGTPIIRRTAVAPSQQRSQQRVLNQSLLKNTYGGSIVRVGNTTYVRKPLASKKPKQMMASPSTRIIRTHHDPSAKNVYTYSRQMVQGGPRKIGNTTIRQSTSLDLLAQQQKMSPMPKSLIANRPLMPQGSATHTVRRIVHTPTNVHAAMTNIPPAKKESLVRQEQQRKVVMPSSRTSKPILQQIHSQAPTKPRTVINMPSLLGDDETDTDQSPPELTKASTPPISPFTTPVISTPTGLLESSTIADSLTESLQESASVDATEEGIDQHNTASVEADASGAVGADLSSFTLADNENPIFITGDDGTVYQVAGQNEQGQTILLTQGSDGQQQCLLVTSEVAEAMEAASEQPEQSQPEVHASEISENLTEPLSIKTENDTNDQVVAQVVRAEPPSPGGTHKVVVMLPDGNLMVTQVSPEEYASLELE